MATITISLTGRKLFTLYPDGTDMVQLQDPGEFTKNSIGERKRIELSFSTSESLLSNAIKFSPAMFLAQGLPSPAPNAPSQYWSYFVQPSIVAGTYDMQLVVPVPYSNLLLKNWTVKFVYVNTTTFKILFEYYQLYDLGAYLDVALEDNKQKLVNMVPFNLAVDPNAVSNPNPSCVYTDTTTVPQFYIYIVSNTTTNVGYTNIEFAPYQAGFYNQDPASANPYFSAPVWELEMGGSPVDTLQLSGDTKVTFGITAPGVVDKIFVWLIKTSAINNNVDFITNYDASHLNVVTNGGTGTLSNKIKAPSTEPTLVSGKYEITFNVDRTKLAFGEKYKIIAIVYESGYGGVDVNSFISPEYTVNELPRFVGTGYNFDGTIEDYAGSYAGNDLICVVEERMKSKLVVGYDYSVFSDDMMNRLGLTVQNDIRRYLSKVTVEVYSNDGTTKQFFERLSASRVNPITYNVQNGLTLDFSTGELAISYSFRNRYESWLPNIETRLVSGNVLITPPTADQNWATRDLIIKYSLELFYDDYSTPFSDTIIFEQKIHPKDYSSDITIWQLPDILINDETYFCSSDEYVCLEAKLAVDDPQDYYMITTFEPLDGNSPTLDENEEWVGGSTLPQLQSVKILTSEERFSQSIGGAAYFCIIPTKFFINLPYKISVIAKSKPTCFRITEDDMMRLTEDDQIRATENCGVAP